MAGYTDRKRRCKFLLRTERETVSPKIFTAATNEESGKTFHYYVAKKDDISKKQKSNLDGNCHDMQNIPSI